MYTRCTKCRTRREKCADVETHTKKKAMRWIADVQLGGRQGSRKQKGFVTKEDALRQERQWRTDFERGTLVAKSGLIQRAFEDVAQEWWARHEAQAARVGSRRNDYYRVEAFKALFGKKFIQDIKFKDLDGWVTSQLQAKKAIGTIKRERGLLMSVFGYALKAGYITDNPLARVEVPGKANIHDRWMTPAEIEVLIRACRERGDEDLVDVIAVALNTGFRKGNLERLEARDIQNNRIIARVVKSGTPYDVPITPALFPILQRLVAVHPTGRLLNTAKLDVRFRKAATAAGLYTTKDDLQRVTIHTLRHTFAVGFLNRGGELYDLSKLLGHASVAMTDHTYARFSRERKDAQAPMMSTPIPECPNRESNSALRVENAPS